MHRQVQKREKGLSLCECVIKAYENEGGRGEEGHSQSDRKTMKDGET